MRFFSLLVLWLLVSVSIAQSRIITGTVTDAQDGSTIPGANVVITGTQRGVSTDVNGKYRIEIQEGDVSLTFSFIGYSLQKIEIGSRSVIDVSLELEVTSLAEVVVIGYGTVRKSDLTGSVASIRGADITAVPTINAMQSIQGKVAGVQIAPNSGAPGAGTFVRIRGIGTFNDASPIYVVDGVILQNIDYLNPSDIVSMEVLKDASATAIYGSRGANGVIMISTKRGNSREGKPEITVSYDYSHQFLPKKIDLLNGREYATVRNLINPGTYNNLDAVPNTDWQDLIFDNAYIHNAQISFSGGSRRNQYYTSLGYFFQDGLITKSDYRRLTLKFNQDASLTDKWKFGSSLSVTPFKQQNTAGNAVFVAYRALPTISPFQTDGSYSPVPGVGNVLADIENTNSFNSGFRTVNNLYTTFDILNGLQLKSSLGVDFEFNKARSYTPVFFVNPQQQNEIDDLNKGYFDRLDWLWENTLSYSRDFGKHRINVLAGMTMQESTSEFVGLNGENLLRSTEDFWYIDRNNINPNNVSNNVDAGLNYALASTLYRVNYSFDSRYLMTFSLRRDGSSKFAEENRFGNFPSVALGWNVTNESFMSGITLLSNLKVRTSWGIIGNEKIPYSARYSLTTAANAVFGPDEQFPGTTYGVAGNPDLRWESTEQLDIGMEVGFFEDALTAEFDYFRKNTSDILVPLLIPGYYGNGNGARIYFNAAEVRNSGFEWNLRYSGKVSDFDYQVGFVGNTLKNETIKVSGTGASDDVLIDNNTRTAPGQPIGSFYGFKTDGIFQNTSELSTYPRRNDSGVGDLRFVDTDDNGIINGEDRVDLGSPIPTLLYGFTMVVTYSSFSLNVDIQGQSGNKIFNIKETIRPDPYNFEDRYKNYWNGEGTSTTEPRPSNGGPNYLGSDRYIYDGSFIRLRNIALNYSLPNKWLEKAKLLQGTVFVRGTNLLTLSEYTGYVPEVVSGIATQNGIDYSGGYPIPRSLTFGFTTRF